MTIARPWLHALLAFAVGALSAVLLHSSFPWFYLGFGFLLNAGTAIALGIAVAAALALGALGRAFVGRAGWWLAFSVLVWAPVAGATYWAQLSAEGQWRGPLWQSALVAGIAPAAIALLAHAVRRRALRPA